MFYLTIVVFLGVIVTQFPKELMQAAAYIWKSDLYRNSTLLFILTLSVHLHIETYGYLLFNYASGGHILLANLLDAPLRSGGLFITVFGISLVLIPFVFASIISVIYTFLRKSRLQIILEVFWASWLISAMAFVYFL
jgi:hypothetical protein